MRVLEKYYDINHNNIIEKENENSISNTKAKLALDWTPLYSFEEGFERVVKWYKKVDDKKGDKRQEKKKKSIFKIKPVINTIETSLLFLLFAFLTLSNNEALNYLVVDVKLLYIIIIACFFGINQALYSSVLVTVLVIIENLEAMTNYSLLLLDFNSLMLILVYLITAIILGYVMERHKEAIKLKTIECDELSIENNKIEQMYNESVVQINSIEEKLLLYENSTNEIYETFIELSSIRREELTHKAIKVIEKSLNAKYVAFYLSSKNGLLRYCVGTDCEVRPYKNSIRIDDNKIFKNVINTKKIFINKDLNFDLPNMIAPLIVEDEVIGVILVDINDILNNNIYTENTFMAMMKMVNIAFERAYEYEEKILSEKYYDNTVILREKYFKEILNLLKESNSKNLINFCILKIKKDNMDYYEINKKLYNLVRATDDISIYGENIYIILKNTNKEESLVVINRLREKGIYASLYDDIDDLL